MLDCTTTSLLLTQCQYIGMSCLYKSHNQDIKHAQLLISHLPFKTGAPSLSVIKIQWRPSTLKRIRKVNVIQNYISTFHSECISSEARNVESKGETGGKNSATSSLAVPTYLSDKCWQSNGKCTVLVLHNIRQKLSKVFKRILVLFRY